MSNINNLVNLFSDEELEDLLSRITISSSKDSKNKVSTNLSIAPDFVEYTSFEGINPDVFSDDNYIFSLPLPTIDRVTSKTISFLIGGSIPVGTYKDPSNNFDLASAFVDYTGEKSEYDKQQEIKTEKEFAEDLADILGIDDLIDDYIGLSSTQSEKSKSSETTDTEYTGSEEEEAATAEYLKYDLPNLLDLIESSSKQNKSLIASNGIDISKLMTAVLNWTGIPFSLGSNSRKAIDCSNFTRRVFAELGITLNGTSLDIWNHTLPIETSQLLPGDLVFLKDTQLEYGRARGLASHVGIVVDTSNLANGKISVAEASSHTKPSGINVWDLNARPNYLGARRIKLNKNNELS